MSDNLTLLRSELNALNCFLEQVPLEDLMDRASIASRRERVLELIQKAESEAAEQTIGQRAVERLRKFTAKLESGTPIEATRMRRIETPDGPAYIREHCVINKPGPPQ